MNNNTIINSISLRRAISEHTIASNRFSKTELKIETHKKGNRIDRYYIISFEIDGSKLKYWFDEKYPFNKPKFYVNNILYSNMLKLECSVMREILSNSFKTSCLCCESLLCDRNWSPAMKLDKIVDEYIDYKKMIIYCYNKKKLIDTNIELNNILPYEIIEKISNYF